MLTDAMKREIVQYTLTYSKGLVEDDQACPEVVKAFYADAVTSGELEEYVEKCKETLLKNLP
jgi:hypothetical protein